MQAQLETNWENNKKTGEIIHPSKKRKIDKALIRVEDGERTEWYADGRLKSEKNYRGGKRHGEWTYWYANGNKRLESSYLKNKKMINGYTII